MNGKIEAIVKKRIEGYLENIESKKGSDKKSSLFKNLPKEYHQYLESAVQKSNNI